MRAIRPAKPGGAEILTTTEVDARPPGPGEARVRIAFAGVNFIDVYHRTGLYPLPNPMPIGQQGAGVKLRQTVGNVRNLRWVYRSKLTGDGAVRFDQREILAAGGELETGVQPRTGNATVIA